MGRRSAAIAGVLSVVYPGLGHAYLRAWLQAFAWVGVAIGTAALVVPESIYQTVDPADLSAMLAATRALPLEAVLAITAVRLLSVADAVRLGLQHRTTDATGPVCPECGGELDDDLEFCPWCTERLPTEGEAS